MAIVYAIRSCMLDQGFDANPVEMRSDGLTYTFTVSGGTPGDTTIMEARDGCSMKFNFWEAEVAYQEQNVVTGAEREEMWKNFISCLDDAGVPGVTDTETLEEISQRIAALEDAGHDTSAAATCLNDFANRIFGAGR